MGFIAEAYHWVLVLTLTLPRFLIVFLMLPFFGRQVIPGLLRNSIAVALSLTLLPVISAQITEYPFDVMHYLLLIAKEAFIGAIIGYTAAIAFWAVASAGFFIDVQRGAMSSTLFTPFVGGETSSIGVFFTHGVAALFFASGGFLVLVEVIYLSYTVWPVYAFAPRFDIEATALYLAQFDALMYLMALIAAPAIIIMLLAELGMALVGRFVPQINVFLLAMPLKSALAFFFLALYVKYIFTHVIKGFDEARILFDQLKAILG